MLKKILALLAMLYAAASFAAVDVNKATAVELDGIKGVGPGISGKILEERKKGNFKDWNDFIERVKGVGEANAAKFSAEGMTVNGAGFTGAPAAKKEEKKDAKAKKADGAKTEAKADTKAAKAEDAGAKKDADKPAKEAKKDKKADAKKDEKKEAEAAKPAASAPKK